MESTLDLDTHWHFDLCLLYITMVACTSHHKYVYKLCLPDPTSILCSMRGNSMSFNQALKSVKASDKWCTYIYHTYTHSQWLTEHQHLWSKTAHNYDVDDSELPNSNGFAILPMCTCIAHRKWVEMEKLTEHFILNL